MTDDPQDWKARRDQDLDAAPVSSISPGMRGWWLGLPSGRRRRLLQAAVAGCGLAVGAGLYLASHGGDASKPTAAPVSKMNMGAGLRGDSLEQKLHGELQKITEMQLQMGDRLTAIEQGKIDLKPAPTKPDDKEIDLPPALPGSFPPDMPRTASGLPPAPAAPPAPPVERMVGGIGTASPAIAGPAAPADSKKKRSIYLPPGFMKARLLTGIDALTSKEGAANPEPIIARVQAPAQLPNDVKANLSGCFVIGNATGSLAKERVEIQLVSLSCVDFDQKSVVDQQVKGFFVDADGKKGLSGTVITRFGATLARQFLAGVISGFSTAVQSTAGTTSVSPLGSTRTLDANDAAKVGLAGGLGDASKELSEFYLALARQAGPVVEIGAGKDVVVVIQEGVSLDIKPSAKIGSF